MADWRLAPTLRVLRDEINARWPNRDKTSDGTLGNASHAAGSSDHNPDSRGVVCALDIDEDLWGPTDPAPSFHSGTPAAGLVRELIRNAQVGDTPQLFYVIYENKIYSRTYGWMEQNYTGANAHDHHVHISVYHDPKRADSTEPWGIEEDMPTAKEIANELSTNDKFLNAVADAVLDRDGKIVNVFTGNPDNTHVAIKTALEWIGRRVL